MREGWTYKKLGEVCTVLNGLWVGKKEPLINIAVIRNTNFSKDCKLKLDDVAYIDVEERQFLTRKLQVGDIIIEKSGGSDKQPVGRPVLFNISDGDYSFSNFTATLRLIDESINPKFLHQCLYGYYRNGETMRMQSKTTGLHNLDMKAYLRLPVPCLSISEQERIVSELDLLTSIINKQKAQLKELDSLAQSIFYDMFGDPIENPKGWEVKKLGDLCNSELGKTLNQSKDTGTLRPYLCAINIQWNKIIKDNLKQTRFEETELERYSVKKGDLLICEGGDIGRAAIWNENKEIQYQNALHRLRFGEEMLPIFCLFNLKYLKDKGILDNRYGKGVTIKHLIKSALLSIPFIVPPLSLQQSFASKIEAIEAQKALITKSMEETQRLFDSRMDYWFA